jgi:hypothetical protein
MSLLGLLGTAAGAFLGGPVGAAIGGALGGGLDQSNAASSAAAGAQNATNQSTDLQRRMYEENVARQQPFYQAGVNALPGYLQGIGPNGDLVRGFTQADYQADPGYQFRLSEGQRAMAHGATPGRGGLVSGNSLKAMQDYAQNSASNEYTNAYNRYRDTQALQRNALAGVVGFAPTASSAIGAAGQNYASNTGNALMNQAAYAGNAGMVGSNALASGLTGALSTYGKNSINLGNLYQTNPYMNNSVAQGIDQSGMY